MSTPLRSGQATNTTCNIHCLYNVTFKHAILCTRVLFPPQAISLGMIFGLYFHKVPMHFAQETHAISGYSRLTEHEERMFKELRQLAGSTTRHPEDVAVQLPNITSLRRTA